MVSLLFFQQGFGSKNLRYLLLGLLATCFTLGSQAQNFFISGGHDFSATLCESGTVLVWGSNSGGQMGGAAASNVPVPLTDPNLPNKIKQVEAGSGAHAIALGCDGKVYSWGGNEKGQLGHGPGGSTGIAPVLGVGGVGFLTNTKYINASSNSSYAVLETGEVVAWGNNGEGQLGNGDASVLSSDVPVHVLTKGGEKLSNIVSVQGTDYGGIALAEDGTVWTWGTNENSALGRKLDASEGTKSYYASQVVKKDGTPLKGITQISGGDTHTLALDETGRVWSWGGDWGPGQLGQGTGYETQSFAGLVAGGQTGTPFLEGVTYVSAGQAHSLAVLSTGEVVSWGANTAYGAGASNMEQVKNTGQLGIGLGPFTVDQTAGVKADGVEVPHYVLTAPGQRITGAKSVASGDSWSFIVSDNNEIFATGYNANGYLGLGNNESQGYATQVTFPSSCNVGQPCPVADLGNYRTKCASESLTLFAGSQNSKFKYTWYLNDNLISEGTGILSSTQVVTKPGKYKVVITSPASNTCGEPCLPAEDTVTVGEIPPPPVPSATYCNNVVVPDYTGLEDKRYEWYSVQADGAPLGTPVVNPPYFAVPEFTVVGNDTLLYVEDVSGFKGLAGPSRQDFTVPGQSNPNTIDPVLKTSKNISLKFDAISEFMIDSMTIGYYSNGCTGAKTIKLNIKNADGGLVNSATATVSCATTSPSFSRVYVGLKVPKGNGYIIDAEGTDENFDLAWFEKGPDNWLFDTVEIKGNKVMGNFMNGTYTPDPNNTYAKWATPAFFDWAVSSTNFYSCGRIPVKLKKSCPDCERPVSYQLTASATTICASSGDNKIELKVENIDPVTPASDPAVYMYKWFKDGDSLPGQNTNQLTVTAAPDLGSGIYKVRVGHKSMEENSGCFLDSTITLLFTSIADPGVLVSDTILCEGLTLTRESIRPASEGSADKTYLWESSKSAADNDWIVIPESNSENLNTGPLSENVFYRRKVIDPKCRDTVSNILKVTVIPSLKPKVSIINPPTSLCILDANFPFSADSSGAGNDGSFQWYINGNLQTGTESTNNLSGFTSPSSKIKVVLLPSAAYACSGKDSTEITVDVEDSQVPSAVIESADQICEGQEITFEAKVKPSSADDRLIWMVDGVSVAEAENKTTFTTQSLLPGQKVTLSFTSASQCATIKDPILTEAVVKILEKPDATVMHDLRDTICKSETPYRLSGGGNFSNEDANPGFQWLNSGTGVGTDSIYNVTASGEYSVIVTHAIPACSDTSEKIQIIVQDPQVIAGPDFGIQEKEPARLSATTNGPWMVEWSPQDSMIVDDGVLNPIMYPEKTTTYRVVVSTSQGCVDTAYLKVFVYLPIRVPNAFSPNGDGFNEKWDIEGLEAYPEAEVKVFNRWGNIVFKSKGYSSLNSWDGKTNGKAVPAGTYYYVIDPQVNDYPVETGYVVVIF